MHQSTGSYIKLVSKITFLSQLDQVTLGIVIVVAKWSQRAAYCVTKAYDLKKAG